MEVDQKSDRQSAELQVWEKLRHLHNDDVFGQDIDAVADFDADSVEQYRPWALALHAQPPGTKHMNEAGPVPAFQQSRSGRRMDLEGPCTTAPEMSFISTPELCASPSPPRHSSGTEASSVNPVSPVVQLSEART